MNKSSNKSSGRLKSMKPIRIFIASPSDVDAERQAVRSAAEELNKTVSPLIGAHFDVIGWETDVHPDIGNDPQQVINNQIPDDFEIFIGIMWAKFGTPTGRAGSGTEEEFNRAIIKADGHPKHIMFYFKDAPIAPSMLNLDQLAKVREFQQRVGSSCLYSKFETVDEFEKMVRIHLAQLFRASENSSSELIAPIAATTSVEAEEEAEAEEEEGFLDLITSGNERFESASETMNEISKATAELGKRTEQRTLETNAAVATHGKLIPKDAHRISLLAAEDLLDFTAKLTAATPVFAEQFGKGIDAMSRAAVISKKYINEAPDDREKFKATVADLRSTCASSLNSARNFRKALAAIPPLSTPLAKAKTKALAAMDKWLGEMESTGRLSDQLHKSI
jgi:hypothetical protein